MRHRDRAVRRDDRRRNAVIIAGVVLVLVVALGRVPQPQPARLRRPTDRLGDVAVRHQRRPERCGPVGGGPRGGGLRRSANEASDVASQAVAAAERTNQTVAKLGASSAEVGQVIDVITTIAEQTNLPAAGRGLTARRRASASARSRPNGSSAQPGIRWRR